MAGLDEGARFGLLGSMKVEDDKAAPGMSSLIV